MSGRVFKEESASMDTADATPCYWKDRDVTQKSNVPAVGPGRAQKRISAVFGAPAIVTPLLSQQCVLKLVQARV
jgi:hypothetical protein